MSRVGKVVVITIMEEKFPQQWFQSYLTGVVLSETENDIMVLGEQGTGVTLSFKRIFEIEEKC